MRRAWHMVSAQYLWIVVIFLLVPCGHSGVVIVSSSPSRLYAPRRQKPYLSILLFPQ